MPTYNPFPRRPKEAWETLLDVLKAVGNRIGRLWAHKWPVLAIVALGCLAYGGTLDYPFVFDDIPNIAQNEFIRIERASPDQFWEAARLSPLKSRPFSYVTFALNYLWAGYDVRAYHATNIALHLITSLLVYWLVLVTLDQWRRTSSRPAEAIDPSADIFIALSTALIFALHPIQIQSVTYIVQRMNSLASLLYLASMGCYVAGRRTPVAVRRFIWWVLALLCAALSMMSKQNAITLPVALILYEWYFFQNLSWSWLRRQSLRFGVILLLLGGVAAAYLIASGGGRIMETYQKFGFTMTERLLTQPRVLGVYASLVLLPLPSRFNLLHDISTSHGLFDPPTTIIALAALTAYLAAALYLAPRQRLISFLMLWPILQLAVESSFIPLEMIYEHRMYLPMFGVSFLISLLAYRLLPQQSVVSRGVFLAVIAMGLSLATSMRNQAWRDPIVLWNDVVIKSPALPRAYVNRGSAYTVLGDWPQAIDDFNRALTVDPDLDSAWINRGVAYLNTGQPQRAIDDLTVGIDRAVTADLRATAYRNRGVAYTDLGDSRKAIEDYTHALEQYPSDVNSRFNRANAYVRLRDHERAVEDYRECLNLRPSYAQAHNNLANLLASSSSPTVRRPLEALEHARRACELTGWKDWNMIDTLAATYAANSDFARAAEQQARAIALAPEEMKPELRRREQSYRSRQRNAGAP